LDFFLKGRASGKPAPAVDVGEVVCAILDVKDKKRSLASLQLACKAWSVEAVMEVLLLQGEHKAKQKAVPALEMAKTLISAVGVLGPKQQAAMLKTAAAAAQMSDPAIRRAALEMLAAMHSHVGEPLLEACAGLMRPPILASLRAKWSPKPPLLAKTTLPSPLFRRPRRFRPLFPLLPLRFDRVLLLRFLPPSLFRLQPPLLQVQRLLLPPRFRCRPQCFRWSTRRIPPSLEFLLPSCCQAAILWMSGPSSMGGSSRSFVLFMPKSKNPRLCFVDARVWSLKTRSSLRLPRNWKTRRQKAGRRLKQFKTCRLTS
jgi:hypothetical protein